jgi:hypothetical protein
MAFDQLACAVAFNNIFICPPLIIFDVILLGWKPGVNQ